MIEKDWMTTLLQYIRAVSRGPATVAVAAGLSLMSLDGDSLAAQQGAASMPDGATAFVDVSVIPMDRERVLTGQTVLVEGDRITSIGPTKSVKIPAHARRIDGRGKFLIPGLADMHTHVTDADGLFRYVANGVTTIRDMGGSLLEVAASVAKGETLGPRIYGTQLANSCDSRPRRDWVRCFADMKSAGYIGVKTYYEGERPWFDSVVAAAKQMKLPLMGHVPTHVGVEPVLQAPYASIEHLWGYLEYLIGVSGTWGLEYVLGSARHAQPMVGDTTVADTAAWMKPTYRIDQAKLHRIASMTRRAGAWNAPTLVALEKLVRTYDSTARAPALIRVSRRWFDINLQVIKALNDAGAGLLLSTDASPAGFTVHRELELLVQAGLTPYQALVTGTRNVAAFLGTLGSAGTVAMGKHADLVLLEKNPLTDIRHTARPAGVMLGGRWFSRSDLDYRLAALHDPGNISTSTPATVPIAECSPRPPAAGLEQFRCFDAKYAWIFAEEKYTGNLPDAIAALQQAAGRFERAFGKPVLRGTYIMGGQTGAGLEDAGRKVPGSRWVWHLDSETLPLDSAQMEAKRPQWEQNIRKLLKEWNPKLSEQQLNDSLAKLWPAIAWSKRHEYSYTSHEISHFWYNLSFPEWTSPRSDAAKYGTPGPDWLDEAAAVLNEGRYQFRMELLVSLYRKRQVRPLTTLLSMAHPVNAPGGPLAAAADPANLPGFYAQVFGIIEYLLDRGHDLAVFQSIVTSGVEGNDFPAWLAKNGTRYGLPTTMVDLEQDWQQWLAEQASK